MKSVPRKHNVNTPFNFWADHSDSSVSIRVTIAILADKLAPIKTLCTDPELTSIARHCKGRSLRFLASFFSGVFFKLNAVVAQPRFWEEKVILRVTRPAPAYVDVSAPFEAIERFAFRTASTAVIVVFPPVSADVADPGLSTRASNVAAPGCRAVITLNAIVAWTFRLCTLPQSRS